MMKSLMTFAALIVSLSAVQAQFQPAEARPVHSGSGTHGSVGHGSVAMGRAIGGRPMLYSRHIGTRNVHSVAVIRHHRHHRHRFFFVGAPIYAYDYDYGYDYSCSWLRWKARHTGSRYWWHRYHECIGWY